MNDLYEDWKPLRNYLAKTDLNDSLAVIRYYSVRRMLKNKPPAPSDLETHSLIDSPTAFLPWELESLAREVIISTDNTSYPRKSFKTASNLATAINHLKRIDETISTKYINSTNIIKEVSTRLSHRQFKYQVDRPSLDSLVRYSKIFNHPEVSRLILEKTGLTTKQIATLGGAMFGNYTTFYGAAYPPDVFSMPGITSVEYDKFVNFFGTDMKTMKKLLVDPSERYLDDTFFYTYHSLYKFPIIKNELADKTIAYVCPIPTLLHWRITSGLYYDICDVKGFSNAFGDAFEEYVGESLKATLAGSKNVVYPGEANTGTSPNRSDWIVDQTSEVLLIESKTKRLTMGAKTTLINDDELLKQLNIIGDAILQSYLSLKAYRDDAYRNPLYTMNPKKKAYVCVTTLEQWYLMGKQIKELHTIVKAKLTNAGLNISILNDSPYIVLPVTSLEKVAFLLRSHQISEIVEPYIAGVDEKGWELGVYMNDTFGTELKKYKYTFSGELDNIYTPEIAKKLKENK